MTPHEARAGVEAVIVVAAERMKASSEAFRAGKSSAADWSRAHLAQIKAVHIAAALAAYGGRSAMTPAKWGVVGQIIRREYGYSKLFLLDVLEGRQRQNGRMDARAAMYASAARSTYTAITRREAYDSGMRYERNELGPTDASCRECLQQTALGWVPLGTLSQPGTRTCLAHCRCSLSFSDAYSLHMVAS